MKRLLAVLATAGVVVGLVVVAPSATADTTSNPEGTLPVLASAAATSCAVRESGSIICWGYGTNGGMGNGSTALNNGPTKVSGIATAIGVFGGGDPGTICALLENRTATCWGRGSQGQLGNGGSSDATTPQPVTGLSSITSIGIGNSNACATRQDGSVWCWGFGGYGVTPTNTSVPVKVAGITNARAVAVGDTSACALRTDKSVWCWGANLYGQLGDGTTTAHATPAPVTGLTDATAIVGRGYTNCAVRSGGTVVCWGRNDEAQLGNGSDTAYAKAPVAVRKLTGVTSLSMGFYNVCAVTGGTVKCWGREQYGLLGNGALAGWEYSPVTASAAGSHALAVSTGAFSACEVTSARKVWCWGANSYSSASDVTLTPHYDGVAVTSVGLVDTAHKVAIVNSAPGKPTGSSTSAKKIKIAWGAPSTSTGTSAAKDYYVYYQLKGSTTWHKVADSVSTTKSLTVAGLSSGKYYRFKVVPINWAGTGSTSSYSSYIKSK